MGRKYTPVEVLERLIGRPEALGPIAGLHEKTVYLWRRGGNRRDAGDLPSTRTQRAFLAYASNHGIPLTAEHLIFGATPAEIDALIAQPKVAAE